MVMPIYDDAPMRFMRRPWVNWMLIFVNVAVFLVVQSEIFGDPLTVMRGFAIIPRVLFGEDFGGSHQGGVRAAFQRQQPFAGLIAQLGEIDARERCGV